ncbi:MAG: hypothetical protein ACWGQW_10550 [bacterium]
MSTALLTDSDIRHLRSLFDGVKNRADESTIEWLQEHLDIITEIQDSTGKFKGVPPIDVLVDYWTTTGAIEFTGLKEMAVG